MNRQKLAGVMILAVTAVFYFFSKSPMKPVAPIFLILGIVLIVKSRKRDSRTPRG
jgi:hypothetical protein